MFQARLLAYQDAHRYRVGVNHGQLSVNAPRCPMRHYQRDGAMAGLHCNQDSSVNFYPNDNTHFPAPDAACAPPPMPLMEDAWVRSYSQDDDDYFSQAGDLFRLMSNDEKARLASAIASGLSQANDAVQNRMLEYFGKADRDYANMVRCALEAGQS